MARRRAAIAADRKDTRCGSPERCTSQGADRSAASDAGALLARRIVACRTSQGIVQLDSRIADVAETPFGILLQAAAQQPSNFRRRRLRQLIPSRLARQDAGDRV